MLRVSEFLAAQRMRSALGYRPGNALGDESSGSRDMKPSDYTRSPSRPHSTPLEGKREPTAPSLEEFTDPATGESLLRHRTNE